MNDDICQVTYVDSARVDSARSTLPPEPVLLQMSGAFRILGDPNRLRLLFALSCCELCVCDLAALLDSSVSAVSHQLRLLRAGGHVHYRREGKMVYYSLADGPLKALLSSGLESTQGL